MSAENAPRPFAFGEPPEPVVWPEVEADPDAVSGLASHTGTDPYNRAIGPAEDHTVPKLDSEGLTVPEAAAKNEAAKKRAAKKTTRKAPAK